MCVAFNQISIRSRCLRDCDIEKGARTLDAHASSHSNCRALSHSLAMGCRAICIARLHRGSKLHLNCCSVDCDTASPRYIGPGGRIGKSMAERLPYIHAYIRVCVCEHTSDVLYTFCIHI
jgi:hypothetical protein